MYYFIFYTSLTAFLWPLLQAYREISIIDITYAALIFLVVLVAELMLLYLLTRLTIMLVSTHKNITNKNGSHAKNLLVASIVTSNVYYFCFTLTNSSPVIEQTILVLMLCSIFYAIGNIYRIRFVITFCALFVSLSLIQFAYSYRNGQTSMDGREMWNLDNYNDLFLLKDKPERRNFYLVSFDSLVSPESLSRLYGGPAAVHLDYLRNSGFKVLGNTFSAGDSTKTSFFNMMRLGVKGAYITKDFFSVRNVNPAYVLFEKTGYKVQFLFNGNYFGQDTHTLDYFYPDKRYISLCDFIEKSYAYIACNKSLLNQINHLMYGKNLSMEMYFSRLLERIRLINNDRHTKWITITHINIPGHTRSDFIYSDMRAKEEYIENQTGSYARVMEYMDVVISAIKEVDDDPIILIYSDHGGWLTRGLMYGEDNPYYSTDEIRLDKHGVIFSVYPDNFCNSKFIEGYNTINLIPDMLECESHLL